MAVIKSINAPSTLSPFSMKDVETAARMVLLRARRQADQLLGEAQRAAEELKVQAQVLGLAEGREKGQAEGLAQGRAEGTKAGHELALNEHRVKLAQLVSSLTAGFLALEESRRELDATAFKDVILLAIRIAERVTKRQGLLDPSVAVANVTEALKIVLHAADVRISIHPSQKLTLEAVLPELKLQWPSLSHIELIEDDKLAPGGCRVFTKQGLVDCDLDEQLNRIAADLLPSMAV